MGARSVDAADADDGDGDCPANAPQLIHGDVDGVGLGRRGVQGSHTKVIGAGCLGGERLVHRLGAHAHDRVLTKDAASLRAGHVGLAHVHAVGAHLGRERHVVIDNERDARLGAHRLELPGKKGGLVVPRALLAKLDEGDATLHGLAHAVGEAAAPQPGAVGHGVEQHRAADILGGPPAAGAGDVLLSIGHYICHYATLCTRAPSASCSPVML